MVRLDSDRLLYTDERIMEWLAGNGEGTAYRISLNLVSSSRYVSHRCHILGKAEFIDVKHRRGLDNRYELTTRSQRYLAGEVNADLIRPEPGARPPDKVRPKFG